MSQSPQTGTAFRVVTQMSKTETRNLKTQAREARSRLADLRKLITHQVLPEIDCLDRHFALLSGDVQSGPRMSVFKSPCGDTAIEPTRRARAERSSQA